MASTYVNDLRLEEMATGDQSGTWGDTTNTNLELIAEAFSYGTEASFGSDADATTTIADGASDPARSLYLKITSGVSLTATRTLTIAPNTVSKIWIIENATSGSQSINISQGSGANVTIPNGDVKVIYSDGAGSGAAVVDAFTDLNLSGTTTVAALDAGSGAITTTGTVTGNTLAGTLSTAAQPNITSVGTLSSLDVSGNITVGTNDSIIAENNVRFKPSGGAFIDHNTTGQSINFRLSNSSSLDVTPLVISPTTITVAGNLSVDGGTIKLDGNYPTGTENVALGNGALSNLTSGVRNTAIGEIAGQSITEAGEATLVGRQAGANLTTGNSNTFIGGRAGLAATTGTENTAVGQASLFSMTTGSNNTALGRGALLSNTTASNNTAVGRNSLNANTTGTDNVAVGYLALDANTTATGNNAIGSQALGANTTGASNIAIGQQAMFGNTTGSNNTAIGHVALGDNTTASNNTAVGFFALNANTTGANNTAVGYEASRLNTTGNNNVSFGYQALEDNTTGTNNTAVGLKALNENTTGGSNTALGEGSGASITTGNNNVCIGKGTDVNTGAASSRLGLGVALSLATADQIKIGIASDFITNTFIANATWSHSSDERLKKNITDDSLGLTFINKLRPVTYNWKPFEEQPEDIRGTASNKKDDRKYHGMIAQEVKQSLDDLGVNTFTGWTENEEGVQMISEQMFVYPLIKAVKELSSQVDELKAEIQTLKGE